MRSRGIHFSVIDKGRAGTFTGALLARSEEYMDAFKPHMVVAMMGINDGEWVWENPFEYEDTLSVKLSLFFKNMRLNKLAKYVMEGLKTPPAERIENDAHRATNPSPKDEIPEGIRTPLQYVEEGNRYRENGDYENAEKVYRVAIQLDPKNPLAYSELGNMYRKSGQREMQEEIYRVRIKIDPKNIWAYMDLGYLYREIGDNAKAKDIFEAGIKANPKNSYAYLELGKLYRAEHDNMQAVRMYEAGIRADPKNPGAYAELGNLYRDTGRQDRAEKLYEAAINVAPDNAHAYLELGKLHLMNGRNEKAEEIFSKAYAALGGIPKMAGALSTLYFQQGVQELNQKFRRTSYLPLTASRNYQRLRDLTLKRNVKLVCMQYPMRDIKALKDILGTNSGILFVENRKNFEEALKTRKLFELFIDMFGGDFGHCTDLGNQLIAKNLSKVILQEVYKGEPEGAVKR